MTKLVQWLPNIEKHGGGRGSINPWGGGWGLDTCNSSILEIEAGRSDGYGYSWLNREFEVSLG